MSLITASDGNVLLAFHTDSELKIPEAEQAIPIPLALVVAKHQGKVLFIFNTWRKCWELPGGIIEDGESPHAAAIRELAEESGQVVQSARCVGWMKFRLKPDDRLELAVLYTCELEHIQSFQPNDEAEKIMFWDMASKIDDNVSEIDLYLARLVK